MKEQELPKKSLYSLVIKRTLDIIFSVLAFICLSPFMLVICILELILHGSPVIYKTKRPGKDSKIFELYKFRSMTNAKDENGVLLPENKRITKFGLFLRRTSIDELPELLNIIRGDMSIIGPRPLLTEYLPLYSQRHAMRHSVRPGLACVRIRPSDSKTWTWREQFENDIYYIKHVSFVTDVRMIFAIIKEVIKGCDYRANDTRVPFDGTNLDETRSKHEIEGMVRYDSVSK
ncbi:sugar transferase [Ruminococcus gauvreauii]|uniref:sugar transferase n=1 Tax=Ruminococcus gauvreauii TaxID=438033 RepID=UPI0039840621